MPCRESEIESRMRLREDVDEGEEGDEDSHQQGEDENWDD